MRRRISYANVAATLALVFSMSGGALAASHYLINSTKQINPKVLKKLKGATGPAGAAGLTGANGVAGAAGKEGPGGKEGAAGKEGKEGPPGPLVSAVPSGKTISGSYGFESDVTFFYGAEVSYPFPLPSLPTSAIFLEVGKTEPAHCSGTPEAPAAAAGYLCIYRGYSLNAKSGAPFITNHFGARNAKGDVHGFGVEGTAEASGLVIDQGTWAYTAP
jgi:hypothetical protein